MTDRDPGTSSGDGQEPKAPGTDTPLIGDLNPHTPDNGNGEDKPNASLIPQPPIFDQNLIQALRNNQDAEKLSVADTRLINKFLRENGVDQKDYQKMDAKTKVAAAADKVELRISSYIMDADAYAKKKVEERGFVPQEDFESPFGLGDRYTVESQKKAFKDRLLSGVQDASVQPGTLEAIYLREIRVSVLDKWLLANQLPDLYTFWAKSPEDIITECGVNTRIDDEDKERFLNELDQPVPLRSIDEYANDIRELEAGVPADTVPGETVTQFTTFAKVIEARNHIRGASVAGKDELVKVDIKLKDTFRILAERRLILPLPDGDVEDLTDQVIVFMHGNGENGNGSTPGSSSQEPTFKEKIRKWSEEMTAASTERVKQLFDAAEQRLKGEIPEEDLQAVLNEARMSVEDLYADPLDQILTSLEVKGIHISDEVKNDLEEKENELVPKIDFAETLRSFVSQLSKKDSARFLLETRHGVNLENISQEDAKKVLKSLIDETNLNKGLQKDKGFKSRVKNLLTSIIHRKEKDSNKQATAKIANDLKDENKGNNSKIGTWLKRFSRGKEKELNKSKSEESSQQPNFIDLGVEKESIWAKAGRISGKTFRKFTSRREKEEKKVVVDSDAEKAAKSKRLNKIIVVGAVLGISVVAAGLYRSCGNGNEPTISPERASVLTAQAKATAKAERSATPTVQASEPITTPSSEPTTAPASETTTTPTSEPTAAPTTAPGENQPTPPVPPSQPQGQVKSSDYSHDQAAEALDLTDGVKDGSVDVYINVSGTNFDNAQAQTLGASGLNLINKDNLYENGALRWKWTLLASDGNGEKYHWVNVGDQIRIPADKLADAYRWSNVVVPDKIASQVKQVSTQVENKNESAVADYGNHQEQQSANEQSDKPVVDFSVHGENISGSNLNGEIDVKNLGPNVQVHVASTQEEFQNHKNANGHTGFVNDIVDSPVQSPLTKKTSQLKYSPTTNFKTKKEDEQMRFIAAMLYERERQKQLKELRLKLYSDDEDEKEDTVLLPNI